MTSFSDQPRAGDGRWTATSTDATDISLAPSTPSSAAVLEAEGAELEEYVFHDDPVVRMSAARNPNLTAEQIQILADPQTQPPMVRLEAARSPVAAAHDATTGDPSPTVRAFSGGHWNAEEPVESDVGARRISSALGLMRSPA